MSTQITCSSEKVNDPTQGNENDLEEGDEETLRECSLKEQRQISSECSLNEKNRNGIERRDEHEKIPSLPMSKHYLPRKLKYVETFSCIDYVNDPFYSIVGTMAIWSKSFSNDFQVVVVLYLYPKLLWSSR
jgi:hypothetical protein